MCITIPSSANIGRSRAFPAWLWLTASPLRLLTSGGLLSLSIWLLQLLFSHFPAWEWMILDLVFGVAPQFVFGALLSYLPLWLKVTPLRYVNYGSLFFLLLASQLAFHGALLIGVSPGVLFFGLMLVAWVLFLKNFRRFLNTTYQKVLFAEQGLFVSLLWGAITGIVLSVLHAMEANVSLLLYWLGGLSYLLPLAVLMLFRFRRHFTRIH